MALQTRLHFARPSIADRKRRGIFCQRNAVYHIGIQLHCQVPRCQVQLGVVRAHPLVCVTARPSWNTPGADVVLGSFNRLPIKYIREACEANGLKYTDPIIGMHAYGVSQDGPYLTELMEKREQLDALYPGWTVRDNESGSVFKDFHALLNLQSKKLIVLLTAGIEKMFFYNDRDMMMPLGDSNPLLPMEAFRNAFLIGTEAAGGSPPRNRRFTRTSSKPPTDPPNWRSGTPQVLPLRSCFGSPVRASCTMCSGIPSDRSSPPERKPLHSMTGLFVCLFCRGRRRRVRRHPEPKEIAFCYRASLSSCPV